MQVAIADERVNLYVPPAEFLENVQEILDISRRGMKQLVGAAKLRTVLTTLAYSDNIGFSMHMGIKEFSRKRNELEIFFKSGEGTIAALYSFIEEMHAAAQKAVANCVAARAGFTQMVNARLPRYQWEHPTTQAPKSSGGWRNFQL